MLVIRLARFGKKKQPFYRIVVADSRAAVSGKYIEKIGHFNPLMKTGGIFVDEEKAKKWLKNGAKPSDTVYNLLVEKSITKGKKLITQRKKSKKQKKEGEEKPIPQATRAKAEEEKKETPENEKPEDQKSEQPSSEKNEGRTATK